MGTMAKYINISTIHFEINAERGAPDAQASVLAQFDAAARRLDGTGVDLVVTCEGMEAIGQTVDTAESVDQPGPMLKAYGALAVENRCHVVGSLKLREQDRVYNAQVIIGPEGTVLGDYRKTCLTRAEIEKGLFPGDGAKVVETAIGRIGGVICFDLNFHELQAQYRALRPDVLAFSSMFHGGHLQQNWAYECRCFFAAACKDNTSDILDPLGRVLSTSNIHTLTTWARINIDRFVMHGDGNSEKFPDIRRAYGNGVRIDRTHDLGVSVLYSEIPEKSARDIAREFELMELDAYLAESRTANDAARKPAPGRMRDGETAGGDRCTE
jgi:predicted amidohydrolase